MAKFQVGDRVRVKLVGSPLWREYYGQQNKTANIVAIGIDEYYVKLDTPEYSDDGRWYADERELTPLPAIPPGWTPASEPPDNNRTVKVITKDGERFGWHGDTLANQYGRNWAVYNEDVALDWVRANPTKSVRSSPGEVLAWREIEPKPAAQVNEPKLKVGQRIRTLVDSHGCYKAGETGTIDEVDGSSCPYRVIFDDGHKSWCYARNVISISSEPKPAAQVRYAVACGDGGWWFDTFDEAEAAAKLRAMRNNKQAQILKTCAIVNPPAEPEVIRMEE